MELTSENKREICETYDRLLSERNHITAYLDETYYKGIFQYDEPLELDTKAYHAKRAISIARDIEKSNRKIRAEEALEYIKKPDFGVGLYLQERAFNPYITSLEDTFLCRNVEDQIIMGLEAKYRLTDEILSKKLVPIIRIRRLRFTKNIFFVMIKEYYLLPKDALNLRDSIEVVNQKTIKDVWQKVRNCSYASIDDKYESIFTDLEEFRRFIATEYEAELKDEWITTGSIILDNRTTKPSITNPTEEEIRTLTKQRKYYKA